jgi:hypothetical protein
MPDNWTTCPHCGSDICLDDDGTAWCQNCGVVDWPLPAERDDENKDNDE